MNFDIGDEIDNAIEAIGSTTWDDIIPKGIVNRVIGLSDIPATPDSEDFDLIPSRKEPPKEKPKQYRIIEPPPTKPRIFHREQRPPSPIPVEEYPVGGGGGPPSPAIFRSGGGIQENYDGEMTIEQEEVYTTTKVTELLNLNSYGKGGSLSEKDLVEFAQQIFYARGDVALIPHTDGDNGEGSIRFDKYSSSNISLNYQKQTNFTLLSTNSHGRLFIAAPYITSHSNVGKEYKSNKTITYNRALEDSLRETQRENLKRVLQENSSQLSNQSIQSAVEFRLVTTLPNAGFADSFAVFGDLVVTVAENDHLQSFAKNFSDMWIHSCNYAMLLTRVLQTGGFSGFAVEGLEAYFSSFTLLLEGTYGGAFATSADTDTYKKFMIPIYPNSKFRSADKGGIMGNNLALYSDTRAVNELSFDDIMGDMNHEDVSERRFEEFPNESSIQLKNYVKKLAINIITSIFFYIAIPGRQDGSDPLNDTSDLDDELAEEIDYYVKDKKNGLEPQRTNAIPISYFRRIEKIRIKFIPNASTLVKTTGIKVNRMVSNSTDWSVKKGVKKVRSSANAASDANTLYPRRIEELHSPGVDLTNTDMEFGTPPIIEEEPQPPPPSPKKKKKRRRSLQNEKHKQKRKKRNSEGGDDISFAGCQPPKGKTLPKAIGRLAGSIWHPPNDIDNNCIIQCILEGIEHERKKDQTYYIELRRKGGLSANDHVSLCDTQFMSDLFNVRINYYSVKQITKDNTNVFNEKSSKHNMPYDVVGNANFTYLVSQCETASQYFRKHFYIYPTEINSYRENCEVKNIHLLIWENHCHLVKDIDLLLRKTKCSRCHNWLTSDTFTSHAKTCKFCNVCTHAYQDKLNKGYHEKCKGIREKPTNLNRRRPIEDSEVDDVSTVIERDEENAAEEFPSDCVVNFKPKRVRQRTANLATATPSSLLGEWKPMKPVKKNQSRKPAKQIVMCDIEAFPNPDRNGDFIPCMVAFTTMDKLKEESVRVFSGPNCMSDFLDDLDGPDITQGSIGYYFNGGRFDSYLHIQAMLDSNREFKSNGFIRHAGANVQFHHSNKLKFRDLCPWFQSTMAKAAEEWGVPEEYRKKDFDHTSVFDWKSFGRHKTEMEYYLKYDILCMGHLYDIYSKIQFDNFKLDINSSITPSIYGLNCWLSTMKKEIVESFYIPHAGKEEDDLRKSYTGGRVGPQVQYYESPDYQKIINGEISSYDEITEALYFLDVKSLYPSVQRKFPIAYGKHSYHYCDYDRNLPRDVIISTPELLEKRNDSLFYKSLLNNLSDESFIMRCLFCVDVECPKDIITPFLFEKDYTTGDLIWNLNNKTEKWYWGTELIEAVIIGYKITHVYQVKKYQFLDTIFSEWVDFCFEQRKKTKGGVNKSWKNALNSLTGKFAQATNKNTTFILNSNPDKPSFKSQHTKGKLLSKLTEPPTTKNDKDKGVLKFGDEDVKMIKDFEIYYSDKNNRAFVFVEMENPDASPNYPIEFSAQILANSRRYMSKFYRANNAYLDPDRAIYYTDTDSMVLNKTCREFLKDFIGSELGCLACDLDDDFSKTGYPAKIVKFIAGAPKGPYSVVYTKQHPINENLKLMEKIRIKGIPHSSEAFSHIKSFIYIDDYEDTMEKYERVLRFMKHPHLFQVPSDLIGNKIYYIDYPKRREEGDECDPDDDNDVHIKRTFAKSINFELIEKIIYEPECKVYAIFGTMKKSWNGNGDTSFARDASQFSSVKPAVISREISRNNWWLKGKRIYNPGSKTEKNLVKDIEYYTRNRSNVSFPIGACLGEGGPMCDICDGEHPPPRDFIDYEGSDYFKHYNKNNYFHFDKKNLINVI